MPNNNYQLNSGLVLRDAYRLLSLMLSDPALLAMVVNHDDELQTLRDWFIEDEFVHGLVSIAISNRIQLDHLQGHGGPADETCGTFQPDIATEQTIELLFREACNKIIHAKHIVAVREVEQDNSPLTTNVVLRGKKGEKAWEATLDLVSYVRSTVQNFTPLR